MGIFSFLFGNKTNQIQTYLDKGAIILDVRTQKEYNANHIEGAILIPVSELDSRLKEVIDIDKPVIAHCAGGVRSAKAVSFLKSKGIDAINGGGIARLKKNLDKS